MYAHIIQQRGGDAQVLPSCIPGLSYTHIIGSRGVRESRAGTQCAFLSPRALLNNTTALKNVKVRKVQNGALGHSISVRLRFFSALLYFCLLTTATIPDNHPDFPPYL